MNCMIPNEAISFIVDKVNRDDAIRLASESLVKSEKITEKYVEDMVQALYDLGPYMVISKGIAIAHARPSEDVLENCLGLGILENPVEFGHDGNDPVKLIFVLAAKENEGHIQALQSLILQMTKDNFYENMEQAKTVEDVMNVLTQD